VVPLAKIFMTPWVFIQPFLKEFVIFILQNHQVLTLMPLDAEDKPFVFLLSSRGEGGRGKRGGRRIF